MADELYRREKFGEAIKEFDQVLERKPGHFWAQYLNAICLLRQGRPAEARTLLSACLAQRSDFVWLYLLRGFAQEELQAWGAADSDFQKASQMPLDDNARYVLSVNRGVLRVRQERFEDAVADLKSAIERKPNAYQAYVNLAQAYRRLDKLDLALEQLNRAVAARAGAGPPLSPAGPAPPGTQRTGPGSRVTSTRRSSARTRTARTRSTTTSNVAGCCLRGGKHAEALGSFDAAWRCKRTIRWASACGRRPCSGWAVSRRSSRRSTATWRRGNRWSRSIEAAAWPGPSWASIQAPSRISRRRSSCTPPRPCRRIGAGRIWSSTRRSWPCATSSWPSSSIPRTATPTTAGVSCAPAWVATARPSRTPRRHSATGRRHRDCSTMPRGSTPSAPARTAQRALELIQQALSLLPADERRAFWSTHIRTDAALAALRRHPLFVRLDTELSHGK